MLQTIVIIIAILVAGILIYAATKPGSFEVKRSISIHASPDKIFPLINDFHQWDAWTPYNKDPAMKKTYSGSASGKGAAYAWEGNKEVGQGDIAITESLPPTKIAFDLHMIKPFEGRNRVEFTLLPSGNSTTVSWIMYGTQNYFVKVMGLFCNMDKMVGRDFEAGLVKLKTLAEK